MIKDRILYIGNDFSTSTNYTTTQDVLSQNLRSEGCDVKTVSSYRNYLMRILHIVWSILIHKKSSIIIIDVFSTNYFYLVAIATYFARVRKIKYITILHGGDLPNRLDKSSRISKKIFNNSFFNIAPSGYLKSEFDKRGYTTTLIPNTIDISLYPKHSIDISPTLLWVRSFRQLYNPIMAIEVVKILKKSFNNVQLCMIGPFKDNSIYSVRNKIKEYQLESNIEITGVMSKRDWIKKSKNFSFFINTTNIDNTPVSVIEAMALCKIIISTKVGGIPFLLKDGVTAHLVSNNDAEAMANRIKETIDEQNSELQLNARKMAESFDWSVVRNQWIQILSK